MSSEAIDQLLWLAKLLQAISTIILTPEIIGPERFERLEKYIEKQDYRRSRSVISIILYVGIVFLLIPWILLRFWTFPDSLHAVPPAVEDLLPTFLWIAFALKVITYIIAARFDILVKWFQNVLSKFILYLRSTSLFRTVSVVLGVLFFFLGVLIELILEYPF